ncbi:MAG: urease accessory UreF family protein [Pseudomonadota bacterium]
MTAGDWRFWRLISQALPVGAFQFSQGLETAVHEGVINNRAETEDWLFGLVEFGLKNLDLPVVMHAFAACETGAQENLVEWDHWIIACRETARFRQEERAMGRALRVWARNMGDDLPLEVESFCCLYAFLAAQVGATREQTVEGYLWMWLENMTLIATKLVPLGHLDAQLMLNRLASTIELDFESFENLTSDDIGGLTIGQLMMSARHEVQPGRLFRS